MVWRIVKSNYELCITSSASGDYPHLTAERAEVAEIVKKAFSACFAASAVKENTFEHVGNHQFRIPGQLLIFWYNVALACVKWAFSHHARWRLGVFLYGFAKENVR